MARSEARTRTRWVDAGARAETRWRLAPGLLVVILVGAGLGGIEARAEARRDDPERLARGKALFLREWVPNDPRAHGGDGLGPVYNETSCVACHNQGGPGGAGPNGKNVTIATFRVDPNTPTRPTLSLLLAIDRARQRKAPGQIAAPEPAPLDMEKLFRLNAGFRKCQSVVVHRFAIDPGYDRWRMNFIGLENLLVNNEDERTHALSSAQFRGLETASSPRVKKHGEFQIALSQRNTPPLFGLGLIDSIPDRVLLELAQRRPRQFPSIQGRVGRLPDGRIGRFGWKAQVATLQEFVLSACAEELGLEVPSHNQSQSPQATNRTWKGLDLSAEECSHLVTYVASLPAPVARLASADSDPDRALARAGRQTFEAVGCAICHVPDLGDVKGIYSDLLLHEMAPELTDPGSGYGSTRTSTPQEPASLLADDADGPSSAARRGVDLEDARLRGEALRQALRRPGEWRTPPLWGFRDSGPYLHDGRAETLDEAVALHGGEAELTAQRYFRLEPVERQKVLFFLKTLAAPGAGE